MGKQNERISVHRITPHLKPEERGVSIEAFFREVFPMIVNKDLGGYEGCKYDIETNTLNVFLTKGKT